MADQIPEEVKSERLARLNALQDRITLEQNRAEIGKERDVLVLYESRKEPGIFYGRSEHYRLVRIESKNRSITGELAKVEITQANKTALVGKLV